MPWQEFSPHAELPRPGTADLCFVTREPVAAVRRRLLEAGVEMVSLESEEVMSDGCVLRKGARGELKSFYVRDPDRNLIE